MKEIKFRLWDKLGNKIVTPNKNIYLNLLGQVVTDNPENGEIIPFKNDTYELSQFTGLQDVNGKEVYEGDILVSTSEKNGNVYKIIYDTDLCSFMLSFKTLAHYIESHSELKIIGNIYENPELLHEEN